MRRAFLALALAVPASAEGEVPQTGPGQPITAGSLMRMDAVALEKLYSAAQPGDIPDGAAAGVASSNPGTGWGSFTSGFFGALWQGKVFNRAEGTLTNRTSVGTTGSAKVYMGASRLDGKPAIIIDYAKSDNLLARGVRDEIRLVAPGLYLGIAYIKFPPLVGSLQKWLYFGLDFNPQPEPPKEVDPSPFPDSNP